MAEVANVTMDRATPGLFGIRRLLPLAALGAVGALGAVATVFLWHLVERWWPPPEEQRWASGDISLVSEPSFDQASASRRPPAISDAGIARPLWDWEEPNVAVYSAPTYSPPLAPVTLEKLSGTGQAHAIDFIARDAAKADAAWSQLSKTLTGRGDGMEKKDPYRADRVLVATVSKGLAAMPADRLLWSRVLVQPVNFEFAGYTVASTDAKTIKIADVENTVNSKLPLGPGLQTLLVGTGKDGPASSLDSSRKTTAEINQQYENLGVDIQPDALRIIRESAAGGDVMGNTVINLSVLTDPKKIRRRVDGMQAAVDDQNTPALVVDEARLTDGVQYLKADAAKIIVHPQDVLPHCPLIANVWMIYEMRKVTSGNDNYLEGLQHVKLVRGVFHEPPVEFVRADDIAPAVWSIKRKKDDRDPRFQEDLKAKLPDGTLRRVVSTDYVTLSELTHWIRANEHRESLNGLTFDNNNDETLVPFKNVENDCQNRGE